MADARPAGGPQSQPPPAPAVAAAAAPMQPAGNPSSRKRRAPGSDAHIHQSSPQSPIPPAGALPLPGMDQAQQQQQQPPVWERGDGAEEPWEVGDQGEEEEPPPRQPPARRRLNLEPYNDDDSHAAAGGAAAGAAASPDRHHPPADPAPRAQPRSGRTCRRARGGAAAAAAAAGGPPLRTLGGSQVCPAGHLHRIQLTNFMCHANTEVTFGEHVTFVAGRNGSGKSALLQGLQACLAASAQQTGRGKSVAEWVATGRRTATLTLDVWNSTLEECGERQHWPPYRHETYGSMIRIVRKITVTDQPATGGGGGARATNTYQVFGADGREVRLPAGRSGREEVLAIAAHFNIDPANPLMIITQDKSRDFHKNPKAGARCAKYDMYMAGTCLQDTRDRLRDAAASLAESERRVADQRPVLAAQEAELRGLERRLGALQRAGELKGRMSDLEAAVVWAAEAEARSEVDRAKQELALAPAEEADLQQQVAAAERRVQDLKAQEAQQRQAMEETRANAPTRMEALRRQHKAAGERLRGLVQQRGRLEEQLNDLAVEKEGLEEDLAAQRSDAVLGRLREHQQRIAEKAAQADQLRTQLVNAEAHRASLIDAQKTAADAAAAARAAAVVARGSHAEALGMFETLSAAGGRGADDPQVLRRYWGAHTVNLLDAVRRAPAGTFTRPPIGPAGRFLRRAAGCEPQAYVLEMILREVMESWIVDRWEDSEELRRLAERVRVARPKILCARFCDVPHEYGEPVVDGRGVVWRRVIDLVEPVEGLDPTTRSTIINVLLDSAAAGQTVLVESRDAGQAVAQGSVPELVARRVRKAFDADGWSYEMRGSTMVSTPNTVRTNMLRLARDNRALLEQARRELEVRAAELAAAQAAEQQAARAAADAKAAVQEQQKRTNQLAAAERRCRGELEALREETPRLDPEAASSGLLASIAATQSQITRAQSSLASLGTDISNVTEERQRAAAAIEALRQQLEQYGQRREEMMAALQALANERAEAARTLSELRQALVAHQDKMRRTQECIDRAEATAHQAHNDALTVCSPEEGQAALARVRADKVAELAERHPNRSEQQRKAMLQTALTKEGLSQSFGHVRASIDRMEREAGGDQGAISSQVAAARAAVSKLKSALEAVAKKVISMREAHDLRRSKYHWVRGNIDRLSHTKFAAYMARRQFAGRVTVDHEAEELRLEVRKMQDAHRATSLLQLSGGERSFTTSSFLLAMGEVLDTPFRAMDEYDVFMDSDRRKAVTIALLEYAWRQARHSQMILLSPQDTSILSESFQELTKLCVRERQPPAPRDFMIITRLPDPRDR